MTTTKPTSAINNDRNDQDKWQVPLQSLRFDSKFHADNQDDAYYQEMQRLAETMLINGFPQNLPLAGYAKKEDDGNVVHVPDDHLRLQAALLAVSWGAQFDAIPVYVSDKELRLENEKAAQLESRRAVRPR